MIDNEVLIAHVHAKRPIWDKKNKSYSNRNVVEKCWMEISKEINIDETPLRKKWKYLRDQFAVELGKIPIYATDDQLTSKWSYFQSLLFLKDSVKPRLSMVNLTKLATELSETPENSNNRQVEQAEERKSEGTSSAESTVSSSNKRKRLWQDDFLIETFVDLIEKEKLKCLQKSLDRERQTDSYDNDDHQFFQSILPHVQKIPNLQKLQFRSQVLELVQRFAYNEESSLHTELEIKSEV